MERRGREILGRYAQLGLGLADGQCVYLSAPPAGGTDEGRGALLVCLPLLLREWGLEVLAPRDDANLGGSPDLSPAKTYQRERARLERSRAVVAYLGLPSADTGLDLETARDAAKPVVGVAEREAHVSRAVLGHPALRALVRFTTFYDLTEQLAAALAEQGLDLAPGARLVSLAALHAFALQQEGLTPGALRRLAGLFARPAPFPAGAPAGNGAGLPGTVAEWRYLHNLATQRPPG